MPPLTVILWKVNVHGEKHRPKTHWAQHLILDFDGVICDSLSLAIAVHNELREKRYSSLPQISSVSEWHRFYGTKPEQSVRQCLGDAQEDFFSQVVAVTQLRISELGLFEGIDSILESLGPDTCTIITSGSEIIARHVLSRRLSGRDQCIRQVLGKERSPAKATNMAAVVDSHGLCIANVLFAGDTESDIVAAQEVGVAVVAVGYGYCPVSFLRALEPDYVANSVNELKMHLLSLCSASLWTVRH